MLKIFLVEDEMVIREAIKNSIDWAQAGYIFAGEAADGELAYPQIMKARPDILITDIKMPFMDGLELCRVVKQEQPEIKIIILSGHNDFAYAKQAISLGVTDYLLKPVSAEKLLAAVAEVAAIIEKERQTAALLRQYERDMQEHREQQKLDALTRLITEQPDTSRAIEIGRSAGIELNARLYNFLLFKLLTEGQLQAFIDLEAAAGELAGVYLFRRGVEGWAFLLLADSAAEMAAREETVRAQLQLVMERHPQAEYFGGRGRVVARVSELGQSFREADKAFSQRFTKPTNQIVSAEAASSGPSGSDLRAVQMTAVAESRQLIVKFLKNGTSEEIGDFVYAYFTALAVEFDRSEMLRQYLMMDMYFSVAAFGEQLGLAPVSVREACGEVPARPPGAQSPVALQTYLQGLLESMLELRDTVSRRRHSDLIEAAKEYIGAHYMNADISLNAVSQQVNMSPSYFSSVFGQEVGQTFVEYLTRVRMDKAAELLMCTGLKTTEIGFEVGYRDAHYFSYIFKKTRGCTPTEYRARRKEV